MRIGDLVEQRCQLLEPTLSQQKAHRLKPRLNSALNDFAALRDEDSFLGLQHRTQLALGELGVRLETRVVECLDTNDLHVCHQQSPRRYVTNSNAIPSSPCPGWTTWTSDRPATYQAGSCERSGKCVSTSCVT